MEPSARLEDTSIPGPPVSEILPLSSVRISAIVACYSMDRLDDVLRLLDSIGRQTQPLHQLVVVIQQSEPLRAAIEDRFVRQPIGNCSIVFLQGNPGVSKARNAGVERASGNVIAFIDDDAVLSDDWAARTIDAYLRYPDATRDCLCRCGRGCGTGRGAMAP